MSAALSQMLIGAAGNPDIAHRYWRLLDTTGDCAAYWNLQAHTYENKVCEDGTLSGANIASPLTLTTDFGFGSPSGYAATYGTDAFTGTGGSMSMSTAAVPNTNALNFDFGSAKNLKSLLLSVPVGYDTRQPTGYKVQYSDDGSTYYDYCTVNNSSRYNISYVRNMSLGGSVTATSS